MLSSSNSARYQLLKDEVCLYMYRATITEGRQLCYCISITPFLAAIIKEKPGNKDLSSRGAINNPCLVYR